jgi:hypothetical protein
MSIASIIYHTIINISTFDRVHVYISHVFLLHIANGLDAQSVDLI